MNPIEVTMPLERETDGALVYKIAGSVKNNAISQVYVRKDKMTDAGHVGPWPSEIVITVEVR